MERVNRPWERKWQRIIPLEHRFWLKVYPRGDCWEWRGHIQSNGYGQFGIGSFEPPCWAHRVAYELAKGTISRALTIDHLCRHHWCVKPSHLEAVSIKENNLRGWGASGLHARQTHCKAGHPFDSANTYYRPDKNGVRQCRMCSRDRKRRDAAEARGLMDEGWAE